MKKAVSILLCIAIAATISISFLGCNKNESYQINASLLSDSGYIDYAENVNVNTDLYPELSDQGISIITGYNDAGRPVEVAADDRTNIKNYFDPNLPTLFIIHGVQLGVGRYGVVYFDSENQGVPEEMGSYFKSGENSQNQKWNVCYFHYERFADDAYSELNAYAVERRVWTRGSDGLGSQFVKSDGTYSDSDALPYSIAEFLAAEYIRTMNAICAEYPDYEANHKEIRTASHSMGGAVTVAGISLLNILALNGQMSQNLMPDRMALLDSYVGGADTQNSKIAWSDKSYINGSPRSNYYYSLENIVESAGTVVEFYYNQIGFVPFMGMLTLSEEEQEENLIYFKEIQNLTTMFLLYPAFSNVVSIPVDGHNPIREWYFTSYKYATVNYYNESDIEINQDNGIYQLKDDAISKGIAPSASATTEQIKNLRGKHFEILKTWQDNEYATVQCDDDIIVIK